MQGETLATRLEAADGRPSGFDYMRIILSLYVLVTHSVANGAGKDAASELWSIPIVNSLFLSILPMFFALSGFLVAGSLYRCRTLISFLGLRVVRIYPALAVEVFLTGIVLGPLVTTLPLAEYFSSPGFFRYLLNVTGHTTVYLPGAFASNPQANIANGQLWTVPWELMCYISLAGAAIIGGRKRRMLLVLVLLLVLGAGIVQHGVSSNWTFLPYEGAVAGRLLVLAFLAGVCFYAYREEIPANLWSVSGAIVATSLLFTFSFLGQYVAVLIAAYVTCAMGVLNPRRIGLLRHADLSYGIFLYHFIVQQTLMFAFPELRTWYWCLLVSLPLSTLVAMASWTLIELPAMKRKKFVFRLEDAWCTWLNVRSTRMRLARDRSC